ncbi:hypothetical protein E2C01_009630 [Portunus trituberculatus]|uniref:Uncharacterized protein n=1 Tax=Portunus trituberculatus TaxID=210409 RepID=A0A5B7D6A4_PORTR|nr:hypothetical protein [Portunus trituberculatus]
MTEDEGQERTGHAPLVPAVFKHDGVENSGQHLLQDGGLVLHHLDQSSNVLIILTLPETGEITKLTTCKERSMSSIQYTTRLIPSEDQAETHAG